MTKAVLIGSNIDLTLFNLDDKNLHLEMKSIEYFIRVLVSA